MKPSRPLYERDPELAAAAQAVDALCGAQAVGGLLIFSGEAGIGKTALLAEIETLAADRCTVWSARGGETVTSVPFHVVRQLLQPALDQFPPDEVRSLFGAWYEIAAPALGLAEPTGPQPDPQGVRDGIDWVVARLASRLSHRPLLLIVDDAHWADGESLAWLASFTERLDELPVLVVQAHRPDELAARKAEGWQRRRTPGAGPGRAARSHPRRHRRTGPGDARRPRRRPVLPRGVGRHRRQPVRDGRTPRQGAGQRTAATGGVGRAARELGASARGSGLVARLERLGTNANRFAWAAAILGTDISQDLAATLAGMSPAEAADCTARLRDARIVSGFDPLEFVHPLIATAVYRSIPPATRTAMHGRAAWAIARAGLGAAAASRHLLEVHPDDDQELVEQLREAAGQHLAVGAPEAARRCLERALREPPRHQVRARCCTNWAAPRCSAPRPPPSSICAPPSICPDSTTTYGSTPPSGSPRPSPTTTS